MNTHIEREKSGDPVGCAVPVGLRHAVSLLWLCSYQHTITELSFQISHPSRRTETDHREKDQS